MKKKVIIGISITAGILVLAAYAFLVFNVVKGFDHYRQAFVDYLNDSKDYKKNLQVKKDEKSIINEQTKPDNGDQSSSAEQKPQTTQSQINPALDLDMGNENAINILLLGIDRTEERDKSLGIYRTDTISLARIDLDTKEVKILCIPRDTYALIPINDKRDKINHAYAYGSVKGKSIESSIQAVNKLIKYSTVDYYFAMDMEPVPEIVDSLGGLELDVELDMKTHGVDISKGYQLLDGKKAFDYIHWRYSGDGDIGRIKRQQKFAKAMFKKLKDSGKLVDCVNIVFNYSKNIKTNFTLKQMISLAVLANDIPEGSVKYEIIPGEGKYIKKVSYWVPDEKETDKLLKSFFGK